MPQFFGFVIRWNETISLKIIRAIPWDVRRRIRVAPKRVLRKSCLCANESDGTMPCIDRNRWLAAAGHSNKKWTRLRPNSYACMIWRGLLLAQLDEFLRHNNRKKATKTKHIRKSILSRPKFPWFNESPYVTWTAANVGNNDDKSFPEDLSNTGSVIRTTSLYLS